MAPDTLLCLGLLLSPALCVLRPGFHSDLHAAAGRGDGAGGFRLHSQGTLQDVLLLDSVEDFSVRLGSDGQLRAQPLTSSHTNATWWPGRPLMGYKVRQLSSNGSVTQTAVLAKVKAIKHLDGKLLKIELDQDRNLDFIQSGVIQMQFSPPDLPLSEGPEELGSLNDLLQGSEVMGSTVSLHSNSVLLMTSAEQAEPTVVSGEAAETFPANNSSDLTINLTDIRETQRVHPSVRIQVLGTKGHGKKCHSSWTTIQVAVSGSLEVRTGSEVGVERRHLVSSHPSRHLHRLPLALPPSGPALYFVTSYNTSTWLHVYVTTSGPLHFRGGYNASGNVVIETSQCDDELPRSTLNFTGWSAVTSPWFGRSHALFKAQVALYHEVSYMRWLEWEGIPQPAHVLPALVLSVRPTVSMHSSRTRDALCLQASLSLDGFLHLEDPDGLRGGAAALPRGRGLSGAAWEGDLLHQCSAPCPEDTPTPPDVSMATACGIPSSRISRGDPMFNRLRAVQGDEVEFRGEEAASSWCGAPGQPCPPCLPPSAQAPPCADRVMSPDAARLLSRLVRLARLDWPQRKVVVEEAWDEPDELHPLGSHGNQSLHYEGRAIQLTLSGLPEVSELRRLAQLAVCAGFPYADVTTSTVTVCIAASQSEESVRQRRSVSFTSSSKHKLQFQKFLQSVEADTLPLPPRRPPLGVGQSHPPGRSLDQVLGPPLQPGARQEELFQYPFYDVDFAPEGLASSSCWDPPRPCQVSCDVIESEDPWDWCRHRALTPRMALRLRRLAALVHRSIAEKCSQKMGRSCYGVYHLDEDCKCSCSPAADSSHDTFKSRLKCPILKVEKIDDGDSLEDEKRGQSLTLTLPLTSPVEKATFWTLAAEAGFDYITQISLTSLQVFVKRQEGFRARLVPYQASSLLAVLSPSADYDLPGGLVEGEEVPLVDGHDRSLPLSAHFRVGDFAHPDHRFFRLDPVLLDCLELGAQELGAPPRVEAGWAYRPASVHRLNLGSLPPEERAAFPQGKAVLLKPPSRGDAQERLKKLSLVLAAKCIPLFLRIHRKPRFGCHSNGLYVEVRGRTTGDVDQGRYAEVWDVDNSQLFSRLSQAVQNMTKGGPVITPMSESRACREPFLGERLAYFSFSISPFCPDAGDSCQAPLQRRTEVAKSLTADLVTLLGRVVPPSSVSSTVRECLVTHCGGCMGAGDVWKKKVHACAKLVRLFSEHASSPWGRGQDSAAFLNSHRPQSLLHGLACSSGSLCLENTQLYSLAQRALQARYRPEPDKSREELLYSGEDNASPLLELVQQEMAHSVHGKVKVFIEQEGDLGVLKDALKVLMIHNEAVTEVEFHFRDAELRDRVLPRLQRHLEGWALHACPRWSRFAAAPFSAHVIPPSRQKRSAELSRERNEARLALHSWEMDWLQRI